MDINLDLGVLYEWLGHKDIILVIKDIVFNIVVRGEMQYGSKQDGKVW